MKIYCYLLLNILLLLFCTPAAQANKHFLHGQQTGTALWQDIAADHPARFAHKNSNTTQRRTLLLNTGHLHHLIQAKITADQSQLIIEVPLPDGSNASVELQPTSTLSVTLQQRYPTLRTWRIHSTHPSIISGRAELTPGGLHILLQGNNGAQWLIEPARNQAPNQLQQDEQLYSSYKRQNDQQQQQAFNCDVHNAPAIQVTVPQQQFPPITDKLQHDTTAHYAQRTGTALLSYDLAISATSEYTSQFGGSALLAYGAIVSTVNRINEIYERELGITLQLISGTEIVFSDPASDLFDTVSPLAIVEQNQQILDELIGRDHYDIGHVFSTSLRGAGAANLASLCKDGKKAQGYSAASDLTEDRFNVDYVAHELGHQLGATHTFNSTLKACGGSRRVAKTAFEPGSGSTIMSYAGLCDSDNTEQQAIPQFHSGSVSQIQQTIAKASAATCATRVALTNTPPVVTASTDYTIPARTPFILNGLARDYDGDKLLYSWDQTDTGAASPIGTDMIDNALIKSSPLSNTAVRYVPDIPGLLSKDQTVSSGESLPHSSRDLNFRLSARDGQGAVSSDDIKITVFDTGADFRISYPTSGLNAGRHAVHWRVAYTNQPPINCSHVDIAYTNDQGATFTDLIRNTLNDGGDLVQLNEAAQHIRVKCSNNAFFALSGTTPHIADSPTVPEPQAPIDTEKNTADNNDIGGDGDNSDVGGDVSRGGGGVVSLSSLLWGGIFVILLRVRSRKKPVKRRLQTSGLISCKEKAQC